MSPPGLPEAVTAVARRVDDRLRAVLDGEVERWGRVDADLEAPLDALRASVLSGGKRLRPAFCYLAFVGAGGDPDDPAVWDAGTALELLHAAALIHDDVIDASARRRGADTVHVRFAAEHRRAGWRGDPDRWGQGVAILIGDLAVALSERLLAGAPGPVTAVFDEMRIEVNVGQYLDSLGTAHGPAAADPARARRICRYKTAKYTVERPLHLGAGLADPERLGFWAGPLSAFGLPVGEAFQLRDDLLDLFGQAERTGKPVGNDLREGKPTLLAALTAAGATGDGAELFAARFGAADLTDDEVADLRAVAEASGAREEVESIIESLVSEAKVALDDLRRLGWPGPNAAALGQIAGFVSGRDY
jgi:geranylgeranyl diphosphate synthase type I